MHRSGFLSILYSYIRWDSPESKLPFPFLDLSLWIWGLDFWLGLVNILLVVIVVQWPCYKLHWAHAVSQQAWSCSGRAQDISGLQSLPSLLSPLIGFSSYSAIYLQARSPWALCILDTAQTALSANHFSSLHLCPHSFCQFLWWLSDYQWFNNWPINNFAVTDPIYSALRCTFKNILRT